MLIPSISVDQSFPSCTKVIFQDDTCNYDPEDCPCGYGTPNVDKNDISSTVITITPPGGNPIILNKEYLPGGSPPVDARLTILCQDLQISEVAAPLPPSSDDCGCNQVIPNTTTTTPLSAGCFVDGCWTFKYDVYTIQESLLCYDFSAVTYPVRLVEILETVDPPSTLVIQETASNITDALNILNGLGLGIFYITGTSICTTNTDVGMLTMICAYTSCFTPVFTVPFGENAFPVMVNSIDINGITIPVGIVTNSNTEIAQALTNLGFDTFYANSNLICSLANHTYDNLSLTDQFDDTVVFTSNLSGSSCNIEPEPPSILVGTVTKNLFFSCNITKQLKDFKLSVFSETCGCTDDIQLTICSMDADYQTMLLAAQGSKCDCKCSTRYLAKLQMAINKAINDCQ